MGTSTSKDEMPCEDRPTQPKVKKSRLPEEPEGPEFSGRASPSQAATPSELLNTSTILSEHCTRQVGSVSVTVHCCICTSVVCFGWRDRKVCVVEWSSSNTKSKIISPDRARLSQTTRFARETQSESLSEGCGHLVRARRPWPNRARNPSSSIRYVADSSHGIRVDFEGSFNLESCSCPRCPTLPRAQPRISPTSVPIRFHIFGCVHCKLHRTTI